MSHRIEIDGDKIRLIGGGEIKGELLLGGDGWSCAMNGISADEAQTMALNLMVASVGIARSGTELKRWPNALDLVTHGPKWTWYSSEWPDGFTWVFFYAQDCEIRCMEADRDAFAPGDYFKPGWEGKR